jgi:hypothetical protein
MYVSESGTLKVLYTLAYFSIILPCASHAEDKNTKKQTITAAARQ